MDIIAVDHDGCGNNSIVDEAPQRSDDQPWFLVVEKRREGRRVDRGARLVRASEPALHSSPGRSPFHDRHGGEVLHADTDDLGIDDGEDRSEERTK